MNIRRVDNTDTKTQWDIRTGEFTEVDSLFSRHLYRGRRAYFSSRGEYIGYWSNITGFISFIQWSEL